MAILSNVDLEYLIKKGEISIEPFDSENINGATIDFRLGKDFLIPTYYNDKGIEKITLDEDFPYRKFKGDKITIMPHHFILGTTLEKMSIPDYLSARVDGKSKIGRKGLIVQTAGHIGPGFSGEITLELYNANQMPIEIRYDQKICQIEFHELKTDSTKPYKGKYLNQEGPQI